MNILKRLRARRRLIIAGTVLSVVATGGGFGGLFVSSASAIGGNPPGITPHYFCDIAGHDLCLTPGSEEQQIAPGTTSSADGLYLVFGDGPTAPLHWNQNDSIFIDVSPDGTHFEATPPFDPNNAATENFVEWASVPFVQATCPSGTTQPQITGTLGTYKNAASGVSNDVLKLTFENANTQQGQKDIPDPNAATCSLAMPFISYTVGANTTVGDVNVQATYVPVGAPAATFGNYLTGTGGAGGDCTASGYVSSIPGGSGCEDFVNVQSNAYVSGAYVTANVPAVSVLPGAVNAPISPINIVETQPDQVEDFPAHRYVCVTLLDGANTWSTASNPTFSSTSPTIVNPVINLESGNHVLVGQVLEDSAESSPKPATYTFSGLAVNAGPDEGNQLVSVTINADSSCGGGVPINRIGDRSYGQITAFQIGNATINSRIAGVDAPGTAIAALEAQYPPTPGGGCLPNNSNPAPDKDDVGSSVVLATSQNWPDALTASYLASYLKTGILLTPGASLSSETQTAIRNEGASSVYIVGGNQAVADSIASQLQSTQQYQCGGTVPRTNSDGSALNLNVTRIWGPTATGTAEAIATYVDSGYVETENVSGVPLYTGTSLVPNPYNNTAQDDSAALSPGSIPTIPVRTAILATDQTFQDAASISSMSYYEHLPILLTDPGSLSADAQTGLLELGIQQVIVPGGPVAVSGGVLATLAAQGIDSLRLAGQDASETSTQIARFELGGQTSAHTPLAASGPSLSLEALAFGGAHPDGLGWKRTFGDCATNNEDPQNPNSTSWMDNCEATVALARGDYFADALTSSVVTGHTGYPETGHLGPEPVLLTEDPNTLGSALTTFFNQAGSPFGIDPLLATFVTPIPGTGTTVETIQPFGGPDALANSTIQDALNQISAGA